jgi:pilus assembly protein CpaC
MARVRQWGRLALPVLAACWLAAAQDAPPAPGAAADAPQGPGKLTVTVGKSLLIDSPLNIQRISVANGDLIEAVAVGPKEVLINGKAAGDTSLVVWQQGGNRLLYDLTVRPGAQKLEAVRQQIARDFPDTGIGVTYDNDTAFVRGTVKDVVSAERVMSIANTLGKSVNLLHVQVPPVEPQILLKVKFADVDRAATQELGANIASTAFNQSTGISTGTGGGTAVNEAGVFSLSEALNVFLFRRDINLGAAIQALEGRRLLEMLAEPNLLAINGKPASFVQGGEFPFPTVQPSAGGAATVTISFREFGIRVNFLPNVTPRGTIRLQVSPEVSSLDYTNSVTVMGTTIPSLATRRVQTEIELESGQSFVIAGLLDRTMTETISRIPGLASIPLLGKLFQSRSATRNNTELLVIVTPELVRPLPAEQPVPALNYPQPLMTENTPGLLRHPGLDKTGPVPVNPPAQTMPIEELIEQRKQGQVAPAAAVPQFLVMPMPQGQPNVNPGLGPAPANASPMASPAGNK